MSDRDLPEPARGLEQWANRIDRRIRALRPASTAGAKTRAGDCPEVSFPSSWHPVIEPTDSYWVDHPMIEFDIEPGRYRLKGYMTFREDYFGDPTDLAQGYHKMILTIYSRPVGSTVKTAVVTTTKTPTAEPRGLFNPQFAHYFVTLNAGKVITSPDTGLTLTLEGRFEGDGSTHATEPGNAVWIGPGVLIATPL